MLGKKTLLAAASFAALSASVSVLAYGSMSAPYGWYAEGNIGATRISNENNPPGSSTTNSGLGGNINVGYKFMPYFAAEVGYTQYSSQDIKDQTGTKAANNKRHSIDLAGKGIVPVYDSGLELFAKVGVQRLYSRVSLSNSAAANNIGLSSSDNTATGLYLGVGGQYYFTPEIAMVGQWQRAEGSNRTGTADLYSIGVSAIFG